MTQREFFNAIINGTINADVQAFATSALAKIDEKNEKRRTTLNKNQKANEVIISDITTLFNDNSAMIYTAKQIAEKFEISTQKASALLRQMVNNNVLTVADIKDEKKNKVKGYSLNKE